MEGGRIECMQSRFYLEREGHEGNGTIQGWLAVSMSSQRRQVRIAISTLGRKCLPRGGDEVVSCLKQAKITSSLASSTTRRWAAIRGLNMATHPCCH